MSTRGAKAAVVKLRIYSARCDKAFVCAAFGDTVGGHHEYFVGIAHRRKPMGDNDNRSAIRQQRKRILYLHFGDIVESACRLVEYEHGRVFQKCPRYAYPLLLPAGKIYPAFAHGCIVPLFERHYIIVYPGVLCRIDYRAFRGIRVAVCDIFADRSVEQENILRDNAYASAQRITLYFRYIDTVQRYNAGIDLVKPRNQVAKRAFAAAGGPDKSNRFSTLG